MLIRVLDPLLCTTGGRFLGHGLILLAHKNVRCGV